jgi:hypothetical protein
MAGDMNPEMQRWSAAQRQGVLGYLAQRGLGEANLGEWPAWLVMPVVAIWAVESQSHPGTVGLWVVSGDLPTDSILWREAQHPRQALYAIGERWKDVAALWHAGKRSDVLYLQDAGQERDLAPLLAQRAEVLLDLAARDDMWGE